MYRLNLILVHVLIEACMICVWCNKLLIIIQKLERQITQQSCLFFSLFLCFCLFGVWPGPWNKAYPFSKGVFMPSVLLLFSVRGRHKSTRNHIWQLKLHLWALLTRTHHTSGFSFISVFLRISSLTSVCLVYTATSSVFFLLCSFCLTLFHTLSVSLFLLLLSLCDLLAMNQGWGSMPEERWEHSGKWLFPARLHHIRMGNGLKKSVCACVFLCVFHHH